MRALILGGSAAVVACAATFALAQSAAQTGAAARDEQPVVVELFTSQGCASCPPADEMLRDLAAIDGVLPLALHVDYWDYIGWEDTFGSPRHTARQQAYAMAAGERMVYTPQIIVGGRDRVIGADPMAVMSFVHAHAGMAPAVRVELSRVADGFLVVAEAQAALPAPLVVQFVRYLPEARVDIARGENAGRSPVYVNIVTDWQALGEWDGSAPLNVTVPGGGDEPAVVILQERGPGLIVAADVLR